MHYESFQFALTSYFGKSDPLPKSPMIVDLGCGPATTLFALGDWMYEHRRRPSSLSYIGIDHSEPLLRIAGEMIADTGFCGDLSVQIFRRSVGDLTEADIARAATGRDGVIFALSYVVHQEFMGDMALLASLMHRVRLKTEGLPTWLLLQDANYGKPHDIMRIWPESRVNALADRCEGFGYRISDWKTKFVAPRVSVSSDGQFRVQEVGETHNVCHFFQQIA